jgi:phosphoribosyl-dephospho-CoA transferase
VRRSDLDQAPGQVALGLALPPRAEDGRKIRIPCRVAAQEVRRCEAPLPLPLAQALGALPRWDAGLAALASGAANQGIDLRVYGSLALQVLTGQEYLTATSDIDLLVHPRDAAELDAALALLRTHAAVLPLDGEIVFPGGRAVAWKEWLAARAGAPGSRVLVKEMARVSLATTEVLLAALEEQACAN